MGQLNRWTGPDHLTGNRPVCANRASTGLKWLAIASVVLMLFTPPAKVSAFGVDECFNDPTSGEEIIRNCIGVQQFCRRQPLPQRYEYICRVYATADSLGGLTGSNNIIGGRSTVHSDSVFMLAQLAGFSPWQAYQIMIYSEATDQSFYEPFDQAGSLMLSSEEIQACYNSAMTSDYQCLALTPQLRGLYKFNDDTGGQLLHLHARYSQSGSAPAVSDFPTDYFSEDASIQERLVNNMRDWAFGIRDDACVAGVTESVTNPVAPCKTGSIIDFPMNFFSYGVAGAQVPFLAKTGTLIVHQEREQNILSTDASFQAYIPHDVELAKLGVYLHVLGDRISHHICTDASFFYENIDGDYTSVFPASPCSQGKHFLWHAWEQGTDQRQIQDEEYRTVPQALLEIWTTLKSRAETFGLTPIANTTTITRNFNYASKLRRPDYTRLGSKRVPRQVRITHINQDFSAPLFIFELIDAIGTYDPEQRLQMIQAIISNYGLIPLPGHGPYINHTLEYWLTDVGASYR